MKANHLINSNQIILRGAFPQMFFCVNLRNSFLLHQIAMIFMPQDSQHVLLSRDTKNLPVMLHSTEAEPEASRRFFTPLSPALFTLQLPIMV